LGWFAPDGGSDKFASLLASVPSEVSEWYDFDDRSLNVVGGENFVVDAAHAGGSHLTLAVIATGMPSATPVPVSCP
jgi:hypothetical protein